LVRLAQDRELDHAVQSVQAQIKDIIAACRQRLAVQPDLRAAPSNFLEAMIAAQEAEQLPFSDADIIANVFTLLLAGEDTTANTLAWAMKLFIDHPDLLGRVRAEVDALLGSHTIPPDHVTAGQQPLIEAFANETMRLKPVAPIIIFEAKAATVLQGVALPAGTGIVLLSRQMATQPEHFAQPQTFSMDRWLARGEAERGAPNPRACVPFGGGPRFCPGRNLALLEIKVVLAMFCRNFELALANPAQSVAEAFAFTMGPENLQVRFQRRA
jgi:cytochrome P450